MYTFVFVLCLTVGIFSLVRNLRGDQIRKTQLSPTIMVYEERKPGIFGKILLELDRCSFGIYLIHMIFVRLVLRYWHVNPYVLKPSIPVFAGIVIAILAVSYGITYLLKLIPGVKKVL